MSMHMWEAFNELDKIYEKQNLQEKDDSGINLSTSEGSLKSRVANCLTDLLENTEIAPIICNGEAFNPDTFKKHILEIKHTIDEYGLSHYGTSDIALEDAFYSKDKNPKNLIYYFTFNTRINKTTFEYRYVGQTTDSFQNRLLEHWGKIVKKTKKSRTRIYSQIRKALSSENFEGTTRNLGYEYSKKYKIKYKILAQYDYETSFMPLTILGVDYSADMLRHIFLNCLEMYWINELDSYQNYLQFYKNSFINKISHKEGSQIVALNSTPGGSAILIKNAKLPPELLKIFRALYARHYPDVTDSTSIDLPILKTNPIMLDEADLDISIFSELPKTENIDWDEKDNNGSALDSSDKNKSLTERELILTPLIDDKITIANIVITPNKTYSMQQLYNLYEDFWYGRQELEPFTNLFKNMREAENGEEVFKINSKDAFRQQLENKNVANVENINNIDKWQTQQSADSNNKKLVIETKFSALNKAWLLTLMTKILKNEDAFNELAAIFYSNTKTAFSINTCLFCLFEYIFNHNDKVIYSYFSQVKDPLQLEAEIANKCSNIIKIADSDTNRKFWKDLISHFSSLQEFISQFQTIRSAKNTLVPATVFLNYWQKTLPSAKIANEAIELVIKYFTFDQFKNILEQNNFWFDNIDNIDFTNYYIKYKADYHFTDNVRRYTITQLSKTLDSDVLTKIKNECTAQNKRYQEYIGRIIGANGLNITPEINALIKNAYTSKILVKLFTEFFETSSDLENKTIYDIWELFDQQLQNQLKQASKFGLTAANFEELQKTCLGANNINNQNFGHYFIDIIMQQRFREELNKLKEMVK